jgi:hypothetical protein
MRKQDKPQHTLPSFARYLNKVFHFRAAAAKLTDARHDPEISPSAVFLAVFHGFVFRLPGFQQLEAELAQPALQQWIGAPRAFRDDVLRYSLSGFHLQGLQDMLVEVNRTLKRNKAFDTEYRATSWRLWTASKCSPATAVMLRPYLCCEII